MRASWAETFQLVLKQQQQKPEKKSSSKEVEFFNTIQKEFSKIIFQKEAVFLTGREEGFRRKNWT